MSADTIELYLYTYDDPEHPWHGTFNSPAIEINTDRDAKLTDFGLKTLRDRYLLSHETSPQHLFARVAAAGSDDPDHAQRLYDYMSRLWFMPATPVLSNLGAGKGLPISCFLNSVPDSLEGIFSKWTESCWMGARGGGIGTYWGEVRSISESVAGVGRTSGVIPFQVVQNYLTLAISQGDQRRGAGAVFLDVHHPEVEEFLEIRKASGDFNRKALNLHHGINITDAFMHAVRDDLPFDLVSPKTSEVRKTVSARELWQRILETRLQTGEPYLIFTDTATRAMPAHQLALGLRSKQSNLCTEITLHSGKDHLGVDRTAVCCLSSVNAETFLEWQDEPRFIEDVMRFLDNVLEAFIRDAPPEMAAASYAAARERSVGLGLMGFHSLLQQLGVPFESAMAKSWNTRLFKHLRDRADAASLKLGLEKGPCPDWTDASQQWPYPEYMPSCYGQGPQRFSHKLAVAPTASISIICGGTSAGIEPIPANLYTHKTLSGSEQVRNPYLEGLLEAMERNTDDVWSSILEHEGSVQHLDFLDEGQKAVFKTAFELDQRWIVELACDRAPWIDQGQSVNLFILGDVDKWDLHMLHWKMWEGGAKSAYYLRSKSVQRAAFAGSEDEDEGDAAGFGPKAPPTDYDECLSCQ